MNFCFAYIIFLIFQLHKSSTIVVYPYYSDKKCTFLLSNLSAIFVQLYYSDKKMYNCIIWIKNALLTYNFLYNCPVQNTIIQLYNFFTTLQMSKCTFVQMYSGTIKQIYVQTHQLYINLYSGTEYQVPKHNFLKHEKYF